jgi:hypothetical protein
VSERIQPAAAEVNTLNGGGFSMFNRIDATVRLLRHPI